MKDAEECPVSPLLPPDLNDISFSSLFDGEEARDCQLDLADDCPVSSQFLQELDNTSFSSFESEEAQKSQLEPDEVRGAGDCPVSSQFLQELDIISFSSLFDVEEATESQLNPDGNQIADDCPASSRDCQNKCLNLPAPVCVSSASTGSGRGAYVNHTRKRCRKPGANSCRPNVRCNFQLNGKPCNAEVILLKRQVAQVHS